MGNRVRMGFLVISGLVVLGAAACSKKESPREQQAPAAAAQFYCPMHPQIVRDKPGDCPICGMRLVPRLTGPAEPAVSTGAAAGLSGQAPVHMSAAQQQLIGVKLSVVERRELGSTIRASARVAYDPDLYNAILEHQQAIANLPATTSGSSFQKEAEMTVRATRLRLRQMGLSDDQIQRLSQAGYDPASLLLPSTGGAVWVYADIYAHEAGQVKRGQKVSLTSTALPGRPFEGTVRSVDTVLNPETRTLRARIEVPQAGGDLKPEMYLTAAIRTGGEKALSIPKSAILPTGKRQLAFVETGAGHYEPRDVRLGRETDDYFEVLGGLSEGEKVVTSANFLIDSESKLKAALESSGKPQEHQH